MIYPLPKKPSPMRQLLLTGAGLLLTLLALWWLIVGLWAITPQRYW